MSTARLVRAKYDAAAPGDTLGIANMGPARPSPAGAMSSGHSPANFDRNTQHQPGPGPGSQAAVCDGGDFTTHLSCFTASSGLGADALCVFANLLTTLHTTHSMQTLATLPSSQLIVC